MRVKFIIGALTIVALGVMLMRFYGSTSRDPTEGLEIVASGLEIPWGLAFSPDGRLFFTERSGRVNVIQDDRVQTLLTLDVAAKPGQEGGHFGIELDPQFPQNGHVYLYYTYKERAGDGTEYPDLQRSVTRSQTKQLSWIISLRVTSTMVAGSNSVPTRARLFRRTKNQYWTIS